MPSESTTLLYVALAVVSLVLAPFLLVIPFFLVQAVMGAAVRAAGWLVEAAAPGMIGLTAVPKFLGIMLKSIRRNLLRSSLTYLAIFVLVLIVTGIWSILDFLDQVTSEKNQDFKVVVTERYQIPSQMPPSYAPRLAEAAESLDPGYAAKKGDWMSWAFIGSSIDPQVRTLETLLFLIATEPKALAAGLFSDLEPERLSPDDRAMMLENVRKLEQNVQGLLVGPQRLKKINKQVGDRVKAYSFNYKDIVFDFEIVGTFPPGRYDESVMMNAEYLRRSLDAYERDTGKRHPMAQKSMNLFWVRFPNREGFERFAAVITQPGKFSSPAVKVEMESSAISSFLEAYKDLIRGMRYLLAPAILASMVLIIANAISIGVRERRPEMAVMKVLGYRPAQILFLVLGEGLLIGVVSGAVSSWLTYALVNNVLHGIPLQIAFFPRFFVPPAALWWGPVVGATTAIIGSFLPAWSARSVKVSEVFARVA
jgi:putative ABC transport system permease protein